MSFKKTGMHWVKRWSLLLYLSAFSLALTGCGEGSPSANGGGVGGSTQKTVSFEVKNTSGYALKTVQIVSKNGNELAKSAFDCAVGATCAFQGALNEPGVLKFFDGKGALVGAYVLTRKPKSHQYAETSATMLGLYVFNELHTRYPGPPEALLAKLNVSFQNIATPNNNSDKYEALGFYYRSSTADGGVSDEQFYKGLNDNLNKGVVLPAKQYSENGAGLFRKLMIAAQTFELIPSAHAANPLITKQDCPAQLKQAGSILAKAGKYFSPASSIPGVIDVFCLNSQEKALEKLNQIQAKLDEITTKIDNLGQNVELLKNFLAGSQANAVWGEMVADNDRLDITIGVYKALVGQGTLVEYVQQQGGLEKAWANQNFKTLMTLGDIWGPLYTNIGSNARQNNFTSALNLLCEGSADSPTKDLVKSRLSCNAMIAKYKSLVLSKNAQFSLILQDIMATVESRRAQEASWIANNLQPIGGINVNGDWNAQFNTLIQPALDQNMESVTGGFANASVAGEAGFFNPLGGLSQGLQDRLADPALNCSTASPVDGSRSPDVESWIKNGVNSYLAIWCHEGDPYYKMRSKYYYNQAGGDAPINVRGVLAPKGNAFPERFVRAVDMNQHVKKIRITVPQTWATFRTDGEDLYSFNKLTLTTADEKTNTRIVKEQSGVFYVDEGFAGYSPVLYFRVSDQNYSYLGRASIVPGMHVTLGCMSQGPSCQADGDGGANLPSTAQSTALKFLDGPTIKISEILTGSLSNITDEVSLSQQ